MNAVDRVGVFINGDNVYRFQRNNFRIDPALFLEWIGQNLGKVADAFYYLSYDPANEAQQNFIRHLPRLGYTPVARPMKFFDVSLADRDEQEHRQALGIKEDEEKTVEFERANINMEMVCDVLTTVDHWDRAVFVIPSDDFIRPMEIIKARGKGLTLIAAKNFGGDVRSIAGNNYYDLNSIRRMVERVEKKEVARR